MQQSSSANYSRAFEAAVVLAALSVLLQGCGSGTANSDCQEMSIQHGKLAPLKKMADVDQSKVCDKGYEYNGPAMQCLWIGVNCYPKSKRRKSSLQHCTSIYAFADKSKGLGLTARPEVSEHGGLSFGPMSGSEAEMELKAKRIALNDGGAKKELSKACQKKGATAGSNKTAKASNATVTSPVNKFSVIRSDQHLDATTHPAAAYVLGAFAAFTILGGLAAVALKTSRQGRASQLRLIGSEGMSCDLPPYAPDQGVALVQSEEEGLPLVRVAEPTFS